MIKINNPFITSLTLLIATLLSHSTHAATDNTAIELSHTYAPYVNFTGTAPGASRFYDNGDVVNWIFPRTVVLGTMGLESNVGGSCDLEFSTMNNFELKHTVNSTDSFDFYTLNYQGETFTRGDNPILTMPCTTAATEISFKLNMATIYGFDLFIPSGLFKDVVTVIVTTQ